MERAGRFTLIAAIAVAVAAAAVLWSQRDDGGSRTPDVIPGEGTTVVVEVLNATTADGLAREVARRLRRAGIDVVGYGSARDASLDSTTIVVRRGDSTAARQVRQALGLGRIAVDYNPRLLLDASVLIGPDLARALGFHP
ncbi:MAG: LytR C-terminal domain-containing protein [Gemmatimonadetes bacterium]|nr:LytR C-terminal domain-containing protein [Gemmatimonadota bacterium]